MRRVVVHIDRLVLRGFRVEDGYEIGAGMQREMERLFAEPQAVSQLSGLGDMPSLNVSGVPIGHGSTPHGVGAAMANGIGKEIGE